MLGLKQFGTPQFYIPQLPQTERPIHKVKDLMSFLNSLQWKADDEEQEDDPDVKFDASSGMDDRRLAEGTAMGLDGNLESGHDLTQRIGDTRWGNMNESQIWDQAIQSLVTGEDPITHGIGDKVGSDLAPNDIDYHIYNEEESNKMAPEKQWIGYDPYHRLEAIRNSVPGIDPSLMTRVGF